MRRALLANNSHHRPSIIRNTSQPIKKFPVKLLRLEPLAGDRDHFLGRQFYNLATMHLTHDGRSSWSPCLRKLHAANARSKSDMYRDLYFEWRPCGSHFRWSLTGGSTVFSFPSHLPPAGKVRSKVYHIREKKTVRASYLNVVLPVFYKSRSKPFLVFRTLYCERYLS